MELIGHGAEAKVFLLIDGSRKTILKERLPKPYRHPQLDKHLNETRLRSEAKIIEKLSKKGMLVPALLSVDQAKLNIEMSYLQGLKMKDYLNQADLPREKIESCLREMGQTVRQLHSLEVIHGDLTTSNMIAGNEGIYLIDFGLSYVKTTAEDRAVDLYVLERAFKSTHPHLQPYFSLILEQYDDEAVLKKLEIVRQRGRKKVAFG